MKKTVALLLLLLLLLQPVTVFSANDAADLDKKVTELEKKYGIEIRYDIDAGKKAIISKNNLSVLDAALNTVTADVVKEVSRHYQQTVGEKLTYHFTHDTLDTGSEDLLILGYFNEQTATISICIPTTKGAVTTGCAPITIVHEFAHALHRMVEKQYGVDKLKRDWTALNGNISNNEGYMVFPYDQTAFVSSYAASGYEEDFADTFAHAFVRNKEGQGFSHQMFLGEEKTVVWKKVHFIEQLLPQYLKNSEAAVANLQKIYTTSVTLQYQGLRFSGEEMQFIGCPQPRYVLKSILSAHDLDAEDSKWVKQLGAWYIHGQSGKLYLAFPGGKCYELGDELLDAA